MRLLRLSVLFLLISFSTKAVTWFDVGIKGGYGFTQLYNKNIWNNRSIVNKLSGGYQFGGKLGVNFSPNFQITLDFLYGSGKQIYEFNFNEVTTPSLEKEVTWNTFQIPLLFRHNSSGGNFFEIGGYMAFVSNAQEMYQGTTTDLSEAFAKNDYGVTIGVGSFMLGGSNLYLTFGGRCNLGLSDLLTPAGGQNAKEYFPVQNQEVKTEFSTYTKTVPVSFIFQLEVNYDLGYIARSNCKRQAFVFF